MAADTASLQKLQELATRTQSTAVQHAIDKEQASQKRLTSAHALQIQAKDAEIAGHTAHHQQAQADLKQAQQAHDQQMEQLRGQMRAAQADRATACGHCEKSSRGRITHCHH